jgi:hypothetical protein
MYFWCEIFVGPALGLFMTKDGDTVMWKLYGFGRSEAGKLRSFGIAKFWTAAPKLAWMSSLIVAIEGISDAKTMELSVTGYEWK